MIGNTVSGKDLLLAVKRDGDSEYMTLVCQVDLTYTKSRDSNDETTKCGVVSTNGELTATGNVSGKVITGIQPADNAISADELEALIDADDEFSVKFANSDDSFYREATKVSLTNFEMSGGAEEDVGFTIDIKFLEPDNIIQAPTT